MYNYHLYLRRNRMAKNRSPHLLLPSVLEEIRCPSLGHDGKAPENFQLHLPSQALLFSACHLSFSALLSSYPVPEHFHTSQLCFMLTFLRAPNEHLIKMSEGFVEVDDFLSHALFILPVASALLILTVPVPFWRPLRTQPQHPPAKTHRPSLHLLCSRPPPRSP